MLTKHFFKTLIVFTFIIFLGLVGVFLVGYLDENKNTTGTNILAE